MRGGCRRGAWAFRVCEDVLVGEGQALDECDGFFELGITLDDAIEKEPELTGLAAIAAMAIEADLPPDFAAQHHHYMKGAPKR